MNTVPTFSVLALLLLVAPAVSAKAPAWTTGATWYRVDVPLFRNGEPTNDPPGTLPWPGASVAQKEVASTAKLHRRDDNQYGGDLQGLQSKLPYLKKLGVDALYVTSVFSRRTDNQSPFAAMLRHVDDTVAIAGSRSQIKGETDAPSTWKFSASDRLFLDFVRQAHQEGIRVVVELPIPPAGVSAEVMRELARRWLDPNRNGDPTDGIDGWGVGAVGTAPVNELRQWHIESKKASSNAAVIAELSADRDVSATSVSFDLVIDRQVSETARRFFNVHNRVFSGSSFLDMLTMYRRTHHDPHSPASIDALGGPGVPRLIKSLHHEPGAPQVSHREAEPLRVREAPAEQWRLAAAFIHLYSSSPMIYFGDEVGMRNLSNIAADPMWWSDLQPVMTPECRGDFFALTELLHRLRKLYPPLREGDCRTVLANDERKVLAFARVLPGNEIIVVMNYGGAAQKINVPIGWPRRLVGIVSPELRPGAPHPLARSRRVVVDGMELPTLRLGGNQQYTNEWGDLLLSLKPRSVRLVIVKSDNQK